MESQTTDVLPPAAVNYRYVHGKYAHVSPVSTGL